MADAGATNLEEDLPRARRWLLDVLDLSLPTDANESDSLHRRLLAAVRDIGPSELMTGNPARDIPLLVVEVLLLL
jgi:hypothetical protein